jgi:hypothetical protein
MLWPCAARLRDTDRPMSRPVGSGYEIKVSFAGVNIWVEGLIVRVTSYTDIDEARAAAVWLAESRG